MAKNSSQDKSQQKLKTALGDYLERCGLTVKQWAERHGFVANTAQLWFRENKWPPDALEVIAEELGVDLPKAYAFTPQRLRRRSRTEDVSDADWADVTELAGKLAAQLPMNGEVVFDTPAGGPFSATDSLLLAVLYYAIAVRRNHVTIYSNEIPDRGGEIPRLAFRTVVLLVLIENLLGNAEKASAGKGTPRISQENSDIKRIQEASYECMRFLDGHHVEGRQWRLKREEFSRIVEHMTLYKRKKLDPERFNPLTIILLKPPLGEGLPIARLVDEKRRVRRYDDPRLIEDAIRERREQRMVEACPIAYDELKHWAGIFSNDRIASE